VIDTLFFSDNYVLYANIPGDYVLLSATQRDNGSRLFDPYFGFAYKGLNTQVRKTILNYLDQMQYPCSSKKTIRRWWWFLGGTDVP